MHEVPSQDLSFRSRKRGTGFHQGPLGPTLSRLFSHRPQTLAFSLCDSPIGLLAGLLDVIHTQAPPSLEPVTSRSRSPFLSPIELEQQDSQYDRTSIETAFRTTTAVTAADTANTHQHDAGLQMYSWSATEVLNWTMMQWLPGPVRTLHLSILQAIPSAHACKSELHAIPTHRRKFG